MDTESEDPYKSVTHLQKLFEKFLVKTIVNECKSVEPLKLVNSCVVFQ